MSYGFALFIGGRVLPAALPVVDEDVPRG